MKKDVSDRLAQAFFENKPKKKKKNQNPAWALWFILLFCLTVIILISSLRNRGLGNNAQVSQGSIIFEKNDGPYLLNFDFTTNLSKKVSLNIDTGSMDLTKYTQLKFRVKLQNNTGFEKTNNALKVCLVNSRQEAACVYVRNISTHWSDIILNLADFSKIHDWSCLKNLMFTLEEWNLELKNGRFLIDDVEFFSGAKG